MAASSQVLPAADLATTHTNTHVLASVDAQTGFQPLQDFKAFLQNDKITFYCLKSVRNKKNDTNQTKYHFLTRCLR